MSDQIIVQPDGKLCVYSSISGQFVFVDATPEELIEWRITEAADAARERTQRALAHVLGGHPEKIYRNATMTWEEAARRDAQNSLDEDDEE